MSHREQLIGKHGQVLAASVLSGLGIELIEKIATPVLLIPSRFKGLFKVVFEEPVSGDHKGVLPDGRAVLVEVKTVYERNLTWSDLRPHQPEKLQQHAEMNVLCLLVWVHDSGVYVMRWPIEGFRPGKGITPHQAAIFHDRTVAYIQGCLNEIQKDLRDLELSQEGQIA